MRKNSGMRARLALTALLVATAVTSTTTTARADNPEQAIYLGIYGARHLSLDEWAMGNLEGTQNYLQDSGALGIRIGGHILQWLAIEANLGWIPTEALQGGDVNVLDYGLHVMFLAPYKDFGVFLLGGVGGYASLDGPADSDINIHGDIGVGMRFMLHDYVALRLQSRALLTEGQTKDVTGNFEVSAGLDFMLWRTANDRDGDGIADEEDECPDTPGVASAKGCPDKDGDGIKDADDACVDQPGPLATQGCPDRDGDGIKDSADRCPDNKGPLKYKGCPDRDGDTVVDIDDECPDIPGLPALKGCPDKDGDGLTDAKDKCPDVAGPIEKQGCPDRDGDGIIDPMDKCPDEPGIPELQGCQPEEVKEMFSGALEGIYFKTGSANIRKKSDKVLNKALEVLQKYKNIKIKIEGHTDNRGSDAANMKLSKERAASVKTWLVSRGVDPNRIQTNGFGEEKPVGDNKTRKGRAQNRRIEFHVIQ